MIKTKALIALFAVLLKVQADVVTVTANTVAVVTATAVASAVVTDLKTISPNHPAPADDSCHVPAKIHHRKHHKACGHPKRRHHKACGHPKPKNACAHAEHHKHKNTCAHAEHHKHKNACAHAEHHKHKNACAHAEHHKHKNACVHAEHHKHKNACAHAEHHKHKAPACSKAHKKMHPAMEKLKHLKHAQGVLPGSQHKDHDSNDFASFEVAQLDILRVTKLDSEHKHDDSSKSVDKDVMDSMSKRADMRQGSRQARRAKHYVGMGQANDNGTMGSHKMMRAHKMSGDNDSNQDRRQSRRRMHHRASNNNNGMMPDSDNDVRAHAHVHRAASYNGPMDTGYGYKPARAAYNAGPDSDMDVDHPRARAHAHHDASSKNSDKSEGFFDRLMGPSKAKKSAKDSDDKKDLNISSKDRKHLIADLKAIDALDREALQYLDTSCGSVKGVEQKKAKHAHKHAAHHMKKNSDN